MTAPDFLDGILGTDSTSQTDAKHAEERAESLRSALGALTPKQRLVIELAWGLKDGAEYSFREIATLMGVTHNAVYKHYHAGMARLGGQLAL